ncbi:MAG: DUF2341 domain-containing protein, partial [Nanopusillaceae archaeon]
MKKALLIALGTFIFLLFLRETYASPNWLVGWSYRVPIRITERSGNNLTDYPLLIILNTRKLLEGEAIYELPIYVSSNGTALANYSVRIEITDPNILWKIMPDGRDIRIFNKSTNNPYLDTDGLLPFWIQEIIPYERIILWVKVPNIPASGRVTLYMYYGNSSAISVASSSCDSFFVFCDDFRKATSINTSKWVISMGSPNDKIEIRNGFLYIYSDRSSPVKTIQTKNPITLTNAVIEYSFLFRLHYSNNNLGLGIMNSNQSDGVGYWPFVHSNGRINIYRRSSGSWSLLQSTGSFSFGIWYNARIVKTGNSYTFYLNNQQVGNTHTVSTGDTFYLIAPRIWNENTADNGVILIRYIFVRPYSPTEPSVSFGSERIVAQISPGKKIRSDCGDIRFTDSDGLTILPHYIATNITEYYSLSYSWSVLGCNSTTTYIRVKIPFIEAYSNKTIYMYYGNPIAEYNASLLEFFTDFVEVPFYLPMGSEMHSCVPYGVFAFCFGGYAYDPSVTSRSLDLIYKINLITGQATDLSARLPSARYGLSCVPYEDSIFCFGGQDSSGYLSSIIKYNITTNRVFVMSATLPFGWVDLRCFPYSDAVYCLGGKNSSGYVRAIVKYNITTNTVSVLNVTLPVSLGSASSCSIYKDAIFCFAGTQILEYNITTNSIRNISNLPFSVSTRSCAPYVDSIFCIGGDYNSRVVGYNFSKDEPVVMNSKIWETSHNPSCIPFVDSIFCFGGRRSGPVSFSAPYVWKYGLKFVNPEPIYYFESETEVKTHILSVNPSLFSTHQGKLFNLSVSIKILDPSVNVVSVNVSCPSGFVCTPTHFTVYSNSTVNITILVPYSTLPGRYIVEIISGDNLQYYKASSVDIYVLRVANITALSVLNSSWNPFRYLVNVTSVDPFRLVVIANGSIAHDQIYTAGNHSLNLTYPFRTNVTSTTVNLSAFIYINDTLIDSRNITFTLNIPSTFRLNLSVHWLVPSGSYNVIIKDAYHSDHIITYTYQTASLTVTNLQVYYDRYIIEIIPSDNRYVVFPSREFNVSIPTTIIAYILSGYPRIPFLSAVRRYIYIVNATALNRSFTYILVPINESRIHPSGLNVYFTNETSVLNSTFLGFFNNTAIYNVTLPSSTGLHTIFVNIGPEFYRADLQYDIVRSQTRTLSELQTIFNDW